MHFGVLCHSTGVAFSREVGRRREGLRTVNLALTIDSVFVGAKKQDSFLYELY